MAANAMTIAQTLKAEAQRLQELATRLTAIAAMLEGDE
jgi:hypothetical protein